LTIWADADSLAPSVRALIARRASTATERAAKTGTEPSLRAVFAANRPLAVPPGAELLVIENAGPDGVDDKIFSLAKPGDLAVTRDIPFAARLLEAGIAVINDRGDAWTADTVRERLSQRDFMADLRAAGLAQMRQARSYGPRELKAFADALDRTLTKLMPSDRSSVVLDIHPA